MVGILKSLCKCVEDSPPNVMDVLVVTQVLRAPRPTRVNWLLTIDEFHVLNGTDVRIKIPCVRLKTLIVAQYLTHRRSRHGSNQKRVPQTSLGDFLFQLSPIPRRSAGSRSRDRTVADQADQGPHPRFISPVLCSELGTCFKCTMVDGLEDLDIEFLGSLRVECHTECHEGPDLACQP